MDFSSDYNSNKFLELTNASLNEIIDHIKRSNLMLGAEEEDESPKHINLLFSKEKPPNLVKSQDDPPDDPPDDTPNDTPDDTPDDPPDDPSDDPSDDPPDDPSDEISAWEIVLIIFGILFVFGIIGYFYYKKYI